MHEKSGDVDSLFALSQAYLKAEQWLDAAGLLAQAQKLAPQRADIQQLLAQVSFRLGFYEDSAASYTRYLQLKPTDDTARRERAMDWACANQPAKALADLIWYVHKHPNDATGLYELAIAQYFTNHASVFSLPMSPVLSQPVSNPRACTARILNLEDKKPEPALTDLHRL